MKKALITGITGQDGTYLAELLIDKGYEVHGLVRHSSVAKTDRIDHLLDKSNSDNAQLITHHGDMTDGSNLTRIIGELRPREIYNLAAQSHVAVSFDTPEYTADVNALGALRILEAIRSQKLEKETKYYQASTSELFGQVKEIPQTESTPFYPRSPYGVAKLYAYWITVNYRESYGLFACNGILFNHESPIRGENFVTRKITLALCKIKVGLQKYLYLGNLDAKRDWGHARDYVKMQWLMLQQNKPRDFVIATGVQRSVRNFIEVAASKLEMSLEWKGEGLDEVGFLNGKIAIKIDAKYFRPAEVETLIGEAAKAQSLLDWTPETSFEELVSEMVLKDLDGANKLKQQIALEQSGSGSTL